MDKKDLNNEIILCRAAVRKARVAVIRKLIKKIKILKSCKKEGVKDKKLKKSERLFNRIQLMKKAKDDDVTRFALRNPNLEQYMKGCKVDMRQNALACLAKHNTVLKKVSAIREKIPNWEVELPLLLNSLGKKNKRLKKLEEAKEQKKEGSIPKTTVHDVLKQQKFQRQKKGIEKEPEIIQEKNEVPEERELKMKKVDDPFFMGKKVIAPKIIDNSSEPKCKYIKTERDKLNKDWSHSVFNAKPFKVKKDLYGHKVQKNILEPEEKLHPSWAAKKVKLIKPFEGKKIKFSDE